MATFKFSVKGQEGAIPCLGLGTATLKGELCTSAVRSAIKLGYVRDATARYGARPCAAAPRQLPLSLPPTSQRHIDTALLYDNQAAVGEAIAQAIAAGEVTRAELFVTTKVSFYPPAADGVSHFVPICFNANNIKGNERAGIAECLRLLRLDYVDLLLIHNPLTALDEYAAAAAPHAFELGRSILTADERALILARRLAAVRYDGPAGEAVRAASWAALEEARAAGFARFIGVSNYPAQLVSAMESYASVMPAVNQLELHPRMGSPALRALAAATGMVLTAYGSGNSVTIEKSAAVAAVAARRGLTPHAVVQAWTLAHGVVIIPRTADAAKQAASVALAARAAAGAVLEPADVAELDALDEAHPYYWSPMAVLPPGAQPDK